MRNGFVGIEFSDLFTPNTLKVNCGQFPGLNPPLPKRDLFRSPVRKGRRLLHAENLSTPCGAIALVHTSPLDLSSAELLVPENRLKQFSSSITQKFFDFFDES